MDGLIGGSSRRLRVVAVGDGGRRVLDGLSGDDLSASGGFELRTIAVGTDAASLEKCRAERRIYVSRPKRGRQGSLRDELQWRDDLDRELFRADLTLLAVDAGDPEALEIASVACRIGHERGGVALAFVVGPAPTSAGSPLVLEDAVASVVDAADSAFVVPHGSASTDNPDALIRQAIRALLEISQRPGLVSFTLKEVRDTFRHRGLGELAVGRSQGEDRFLDAARVVLESPSLFRPLRNASCVAVHVRASASSTLFDLSDLSTAVALACSRETNIWTALYLDSPEEDSVEVTLLAAGLPRP